jgi:hypothetical protein
MTQAVNARRDGDTFQARIFWLKAAKLLDDEGNVVRVGFESGPKGFDDVWVEYDQRNAPLDQYGQSLAIERLQCKWHAGLGVYTHIDLTRPEYINATTKSLLQRAYGAFDVDRTARKRSRIKLVTNHRVDQADVLHGLIRSRSHTLKVDELFAGKTDRSATGKLRKVWREHLGVDDDELKALCATLGFSHTGESLDDLRERLDEACRAFGLRRVEPRASGTIYDDTVFQWASQGRLDFDRKSFREACAREGFLADQTKKLVIFGVKSFEHAFDRLEDRCERVLNLVSEFDDRFIRDATAWQSTLQPALSQFLREIAVSSGPRLRIALDTHATLAFAAGAVLNAKSGRLVEIEQRTPDRKVWASDDAAPAPDWPSWEFATYEIARNGDGIALAVGLTHDVEAKVREFVENKLHSVRKLLVAKPHGGPSQRVVRSGAHASLLAEALAAQIKREREGQLEFGEDRVHLFIAGPNGFTFYLGQHIESFKPVTLYEFDFESLRDKSYQPSLSLPENTGLKGPRRKKPAA